MDDLPGVQRFLIVENDQILPKLNWVDFDVLARSSVNLCPIGVLKVSTDSLDPEDFKSSLKIQNFLV